MRAPTYQEVKPWALGLYRVGRWCCWLSVANSLALAIVRPTFPLPVALIVWLWWVPIAAASVIVSHLMVKWAEANVREAEARLREIEAAFRERERDRR